MEAKSILNHESTYKVRLGARSALLDLHAQPGRTVVCLHPAKMHFLLPALSLLGVALAAPTGSSSASNGTPSAVVKNGTISGSHSDTYNQDMFLGIPYAQPPVNELRFRNPQSLNTTFNSTFDATSYAPSCVGYGVWSNPRLQRLNCTHSTSRVIKLGIRSLKIAWH